MSSKLATLAAVVAAAMLSACVNESSDSGNSVNQGELLPGTVMRTSSFDSSEQCPAGGVVIEIGTDTNKDGALQDDEVEQSHTICNGLSGVDGQDGAPGQDGADGQDGAPGQDGADGQDGAPGQDGADGQDGAPGQDGADGQDGTNGRTSLILVEAVLPGHATCEYGGVHIIVGLEDENTAGTIDPDTSQTTFLCRETPECTWQDNGDGTALVTCNGDSTYTVLTAEALDFVETISCAINIPRPGGAEGETSLMIYTIDELSSALKFIRLTIIDGANEYATSRLIASNSSAFELSQITAFYDVLGAPNGGRFVALLNQASNQVAFVYFDVDAVDVDNPDGEIAFVGRALTDSEGPGLCTQTLYD